MRKGARKTRRERDAMLRSEIGNRNVKGSDKLGSKEILFCWSAAEFFICRSIFDP
jgi:hypothetical protein